MRITNLFMLVCWAAPAVWGSGTGTTSANFLKIGINPRAIAMGDAQSASSDDVYATYWNPAGLARLQIPEAGFVHAELIEGIRSEYIAYGHPIPALGTLATSLTHLHQEPLNAYDAVGQPRSDVNASSTALGVSFARSFFVNRRMGSEMTAGITGKWIQEQLDTSRAHAFATDMGVQYIPGQLYGDALQGFRAGAALRNLGTSLQFDQESFPLPMSLTTGITWTGIWLGEMVSLAVDAEKARDHRPTVGAGVELSTLRLLILRGGYTSKGEAGTGLRLGLGLRLRSFQFDYAYAAGAIRAVHRFGITVRFGIAPADPVVLAQSSYQKGIQAYEQRRYTEALVDFNKALEIDPSHPEALQKMKDAYEKLQPTPAQ